MGSVCCTAQPTDAEKWNWSHVDTGNTALSCCITHCKLACTLTETLHYPMTADALLVNAARAAEGIHVKYLWQSAKRLVMHLSRVVLLHQMGRHSRGVPTSWHGCTLPRLCTGGAHHQSGLGATLSRGTMGIMQAQSGRTWRFKC